MTTDMTRRQLLGRSSAVGLGIAFAGSIEAIAGPGTALAATPGLAKRFRLPPAKFRASRLEKA